ncbi:MAG: 50S ribosomal protein L15 [Coriobacteriia bacterium]|nr:50S ribosomal protein L15 [Coriobacteriia bacterium]MCL2870412.1 50S ribosomal protein L15 [Coriobacteriia bacterium]
MQLHDLMPAPGSTKTRKRVGRGHGSGRGGRSGRGQDGQGSRAGGTKGPGFEGGQLPLYKRLPKLGGFVSHNRVEYAVVNVGRLNELFNDGDVITPEALEEKGAIKSALKLPVKVLGDGELTKKLTVKVERVSASAKAKIESAGGAVE